MRVLTIAWRNVWRNRLRTALSALAVFASTLIVCLVLSLEAGYIGDMISNIKNHVTGDVRIIRRDFVENERVRPLQYSVPDTDGALAALAALPEVRLAVPLTDFFAAMYRGGEKVPCRVVGVDFARSPLARAENNRLVDGSYPIDGAPAVLVTQALAEEFSLAPGSRVTLLAGTAIGGMNGKTFAVSGVISIADVDFSGRLVMMDWRVASDYLRMDGNALQLQAFLREDADEDTALASIASALRQVPTQPETEALEIKPWHAVNGTYGFLKLSGLVYAVFSAVFYLLASTVVFNTTMMSVLERKREIGTLGALGVPRSTIVRLFLAESLIIALLGTTAGLAVGGALIGVVGRVGLDIQALYGNDFEGFGFSRVIHPYLAPRGYITAFLMGTLISAAACFFPARMAARVEPVDALADR